MNTTKKALLTGILASLGAFCAAHADTYYIGSALGAVNNTAAANPLGGSITHLDPAGTGRSSVWNLGGAEVVLPTGHTYILDNIVYVTNGTLTINPGVIIRGQPRSTAFADPGALAITKGAKINANANSGAPIIFTTASTTGAKLDGKAAGVSPAFWDSNPAGSPRALVNAGASATGLWGGVMILGKAPTNVDRNLRGADNSGATTGAFDDADRISFHDENPGTTLINQDDSPSIEGVSTASVAYTNGFDRYGGNHALDNSGVLRYVSIRHGGSLFATNTEINGLTLGGVGAGTIIDYIEIYGNQDDGIEVFGGTVNLKHCVVMGVEDDMFDFDAGYTGFAQFLFGVGWGNTGNGSAVAEYTDRAIEWDGSYRLERPEGFRAAPAITQTISGGGVGAVTSNQSAAGGNTVLNATIIGNVYSGPATLIATNATNSDNNDRSRGLMLRDQASPTLLNSIILPTGYGVRAAYVGAEDYTSVIQRLETGRGTISGVTFFGLGGASTGYIGQGAVRAAGTNGAVRTDSITAEIDAVLTPAAKVNLFGVDPLFAISVNEALTTGSIDPRPLDGYSSGSPTVAPTLAVPEGAGAEAAQYRGAFSDDPFSDLWTTGWTAANVRGIIVN